MAERYRRRIAGVLAETELSRPLVLPVTPIAQHFVWISGGGATLACSENGSGEKRLNNAAADGIHAGGAQVGGYGDVASFLGAGASGGACASGTVAGSGWATGWRG